MVLDRYVTILIQGTKVPGFYLGQSKLGKSALGFTVEVYKLSNNETLTSFILGQSKLGITRLGFFNAKHFGISLGSLNLEQLICESEFSFGQMCASKFEVQCFNLDVDVSGFKIEVYLTENDNVKKLFTGIIDSSTVDSFGGYRDIVAYDNIYYKRETNVAEWWENYWNNLITADEPNPHTTIRELRTSLCEYVGLEYDDRELINDNLLVPQYNNFTTVSFDTIMRMLCEVSAVFPHINGDGVLEFIQLSELNSKNLLGKYEKGNSTFEDYSTSMITGVSLFNASNEFVRKVGNVGNTYNISNNIFLLSLSTAELDTALINIYNAINIINYTPCTLNMIVSDMSLSLGDCITTDMGVHYVMSQIFSGSLFVEQEIKSVAYSKELNQYVANTSQDIVEGKKYSSIVHTIEGVKVEVSDVQKEIIDVDSALVNTTTRVTTLEARADGIEANFVQKSDKDYVDLTTNIKMDIDGITIKGTTQGEENPTKLNINSSGVYIKDTNNNVITSMTTNEFRTGVWVLQQTNDNNSFNIFKEQ